MLARPVGFDTAFDGLVVANSDVIVKTQDKSLTLLTKNNIVSFSYKSRNSFFAFNYPSETISIEVFGWSRLSQLARAWLSAGNAISVFFKVNGLTTTGCHYAMITDVDVDHRNWKATITAQGYLQTIINNLCSFNVMNGKVNENNSYSAPTYNYKETHYIVGGIATAHSYYIAFSQYPLPNFFTVKQAPTNISEAEMLQNIALVSGSGLKMDEKNIRFEQHDNILNTNKANFSVINIHGDYTITTEKQSYDLTKVLGCNTNSILIPSGDNYTLTMAENTISIPVSVSSVSINFDKNLTVYLTGLDCGIGGNLLEADYTITNNVLTITAPNIPVGTPAQYWAVVLNPFEATQPNSITSDIVVYSPLFNSSFDSSNILYAQNKIRDYFSNKRIIEYKGRINPAIETLDLLTTDSIDYWVEEIDIDFNGGFTGRIKGRIKEAENE